jgi:hypothetical protein
MQSSNDVRSIHTQGMNMTLTHKRPAGGNIQSGVQALVEAMCIRLLRQTVRPRLYKRVWSNYTQCAHMTPPKSVLRVAHKMRRGNVCRDIDPTPAPPLP